MIFKLIFSEAEIWNCRLIVLFAFFDAEVVNLNVHTMAQFEEPNDILLAVSDSSLETTGWKPEGNNMVGDVSQIEVEAVDNQAPLLEGDAFADAVEWIHVFDRLVLLHHFLLLVFVHAVVGWLPRVQFFQIFDALFYFE